MRTEIVKKEITPGEYQKFRDVFFPFSVGFDTFFDRLNSTAEHCHSTNTFPPYNILKSENKTYIEVALAGYKRNNIEVTVEDGVLSIVGNKDIPSEDTEIHQTYRGIANRNFIRKFSLGEYVEVNSAEFKDGLLTVALERIIPEAKKAKTIEIK